MKSGFQARLDQLEQARELSGSDPALQQSGVQDGNSSQSISNDGNLKTSIDELQRRTLAILRRAEGAGRADVALRCIREARSNMELLARLTGEFDRPAEDVRIGVLVMMPNLDSAEPPAQVITVQETR